MRYFQNNKSGMRRRTCMEQNHIPHLTRMKSLPTKMGDLKMARFILDFMINSEGKERDLLIEKVMDVIERDKLLSQGVTSIRCLDETNNNQFWSHDSFFTENVGQVTTSPMMNVLSKEQLENDREILSKY